jgi:serine/threonine-protein kinase RsbW
VQERLASASRGPGETTGLSGGTKGEAIGEGTFEYNQWIDRPVPPVHQRGGIRMSDPEQIPPSCEFDLDKLMIKLDEVIPSDIRIVDEAVEKIMRLIEGRHCWEDVENIDLAIQEALVNAILHGNKSDLTKAVRVCVALAEDCSMLIVVKDAGSGFDPNQLPNPLMAENLLATNGRGIFLINRLMEDVRFSVERGTAISMRRRGKESKLDFK